MKNDNITLSVIIPLYNASKTLDRCITSIQAQKGIELEIICVDDESTDNTLELCRDFQEKDNRIQIVSKKNGGVASARNKGLEIARGKYITFVDQDDWLEENAYPILLSKLSEVFVDVIVFNYTKDFDNNIKKMENRGKIDLFIELKSDLIKYAFFREEYRGFAAFVWNKIFRREFLAKNRIWFDETLRRGDDVLFFADVVVAGASAMYIDKHLYHYVQRHDSVTHTLTKENIGCLGEILEGYRRAIEKLGKVEVSEESLSYMKCFYTFHASNLLELALKEELLEETIYYKNEMQIYLKEYFSQNSMYKDRLVRINKLLEEV